MTNTSPEERRRAAVARVFDDFRLDGRSPSPAALKDAEDYIAGRRTLDELIDDVVARHTRTDKP